MNELFAQIMSICISFYLTSFIHFILAGILFSIPILSSYPRCSNQKDWWNNRSVRIDFLYFLFGPLFNLAIRYITIFLLFIVLFLIMPVQNIYDYLFGGHGLLSKLDRLSQGIVYLFLSDFLMYWIHRIFHGKILWPIHMIHHTCVDVDWTTSYRFHPLNLAMGPWLVSSSLFFMGISPANILWVSYIEVFMSYFVHSNLNITLGPLKRIISTPVFHRWHHTRELEGSASNFGGIFALWDVIFGTYYLPPKKLPNNYGIKDFTIDDSFLKQLLLPIIIYYNNIILLRDGKN